MTLQEFLVTASSSAVVTKIIDYAIDFLKEKRSNKQALNLSASERLASLQEQSQQYAKDLLRAKDALNRKITGLQVKVALLEAENKRLRNGDK
jgi:hypothetical protein